MEKQCNCVRNMPGYGPSPIPQEGKWDQTKEITQISGFSHGCGTCAPQQGTCKLTLNVKNGIIKEALVETIGCSGMTHSAAMAGEILTGKTLLEALNTDLVCDAINDAMKNIFLQLVYGRSQSAFSLGGLEVGTSMEEAAKPVYLDTENGRVAMISVNTTFHSPMMAGNWHWINACWILPFPTMRGARSIFAQRMSMRSGKRPRERARHSLCFAISLRPKAKRYR